MLRKSFFAAAAALVVAALASPQAAEAGWRRSAEPAGWDHTRVVTHRVYYPRYAHVYSFADPYAYRYEPRGYYPYYNSGYWVPACQYCRPRYNFRLPKYYKAWGATKPGYHHHQWHNKHHGGHRHHHW